MQSADNITDESEPQQTQAIDIEKQKSVSVRDRLHNVTKSLQELQLTTKSSIGEFLGITDNHITGVSLQNWKAGCNERAKNGKTGLNFSIGTLRNQKHHDKYTQELEETLSTLSTFNTNFEDDLEDSLHNTHLNHPTTANSLELLQQTSSSQTSQNVDVSNPETSSTFSLPKIFKLPGRLPIKVNSSTCAGDDGKEEYPVQAVDNEDKCVSEPHTSMATKQEVKVTHSLVWDASHISSYFGQETDYEMSVISAHCNIKDAVDDTPFYIQKQNSVQSLSVTDVSVKDTSSSIWDVSEVASAAVAAALSNVLFAQSTADLFVEPCKIQTHEPIDFSVHSALDKHKTKVAKLQVITNPLYQQESETSLNLSTELNTGLKLYGTDAYMFYELLTDVEKKNRLDELNVKRNNVMDRFKWQKERIDELLSIAKDYYLNPSHRACERWQKLKSEVKSCQYNSTTDLQSRIASLPTHFPLFTYVIMFAQLVAFCVYCPLGGIAHIGLEPKLDVKEDVRTFNGIETVHKWQVPNIWIGPSARYLIRIGAIYAPCMREDYEINIGIVEKNYSRSDSLGCCEMLSRNAAGTTTDDECDQLTNGIGHWKAGIKCSLRSLSESSVAHTMRPCCMNSKGQCLLASHEHCQFLGGVYYMKDKEHCSQINCLDNVCSMGISAVNTTYPWMPANPNQWWRMFLALIYNQGIIQLVLFSVCQFVLMRPIEMLAGWFRIMIIYVLTGVTGLLAGATFSPYIPHMGPAGALFGMVAVAIIEFLQSWTLVKKPWIELLKFMLVIILFLISGTLPYLSNFSLVTGFITGILCALLLLPYVTFNRWHTHFRRTLVMCSLPSLLIWLFLIACLFYKVQSLQSCGICKAFDCVPYTATLCEDTAWL